ncbi:MAG: acyl transferase [Saprospiraceae bacterium]
MLHKDILTLKKEDFKPLALSVFNLQAKDNLIYKQYLELLRIQPSKINQLNEIPFLPIELFKTQEIKTGDWKEQKYFLSSGTSQHVRSKHYIKDIQWYEDISWKIFNDQILNLTEYQNDKIEILGLMPSAIESPYSSLTFMIDSFARKINTIPVSTPFIADFTEMYHRIIKNNQLKIRTILIGVSFALVDFAELFPISSEYLSIIETGGMKSSKRQIEKAQILEILKDKFPQSAIYSEYGMTEMLSQSYSRDGINYNLPNCLKVVITAIDDPTNVQSSGKRGRINLIDLANFDSCSFLQTGDAGIINADETFQVLGRIQEEELRGCNLNYEELIS